MLSRAHDGPLFAARLLLAVALLPTGIARALNVSGFALTLAGSGMPAPNAVATGAVIVQVFGPLAVMLGVLPRISGVAMALFSAITAVMLHAFWQFTGPAFVAERTLMLADLGLAGGYLIYALTGPGGWSWEGWRASASSARAKPAGKAPAKSGGKPVGKRSPARAAA